MKVNVIDIGAPESFQPIVSDRTVKDCIVAGITVESALIERIKKHASKVGCSKEKCFNVRADFWPSFPLLEKMLSFESSIVYVEQEGNTIPAIWLAPASELPENAIVLELDKSSKILRYSWDLLSINEELIGDIRESKIDGTLRDGVNVDGNIVVGEGTVLLPGVYIEGNVIIGKGCKIGPNCYIRGNTYIGDNCHVGQAVELKNSILMDNVSIGHLSYVGDSIIGEETNFGAGTITANLRHDEKNHVSRVNRLLIDTGRRKLGTIVGDGVHTGINTSIYPGRKIWPGLSTLPGDIVKKDMK